MIWNSPNILFNVDQFNSSLDPMHIVTINNTCEIHNILFKRWFIALRSSFIFFLSNSVCILIGFFFCHWVSRKIRGNFHRNVCVCVCVCVLFICVSFSFFKQNRLLAHCYCDCRFTLLVLRFEISKYRNIVDCSFYCWLMCLSVCLCGVWWQHCCSFHFLILFYFFFSISVLFGVVSFLSPISFVLEYMYSLSFPCVSFQTLNSI